VSGHLEALERAFHLIDRSGKVIGWLALPTNTRLIDLEHLRHLGASRLELAK
jgi:hypothetical protein